MVCVVGGGESRQVGDVFAERLMSVHGKIRKGPILVVLRGERFARRLEVIEIFLRPPVGETALRVELAALIVEAMTDFVTNHRSNRAVIVRSVGGRIEERRLQN